MTAEELMGRISERNLPPNTEVRVAPLSGVDPEDLGIASGDLVLYYNEDGTIEAVAVAV